MLELQLLQRMQGTRYSEGAVRVAGCVQVLTAAAATDAWGQMGRVW
jgi:hypothetical protein